MIRFRIGSIPVLVHPGHWLWGLIFGLTAGVTDDPGMRIAVVLIWIAIVFVSVLFHELGHALSFRAFGYSPTIQLLMFGGVTTPGTDGPLPWGRDVISTLAGPLFGSSLGVLCWVLAARHPDGLLGYSLGHAALANFVWAVFNLLPVLPLDGGRVSRAVLGRAFGKGGVAAAHALGVLTCAGLAYLLYRKGWAAPVTLVFLLLFAFQNFQALMTVWRSDPDSAPPRELVEAEALYRAGQIAAARERATGLLRANLPPSIRSRIHHLLGWAALKEGEGRRALDEFSQVQGRPVELPAVAGAFSLIGDDLRALPLWEQAARQTRDPSVLHEWAGTLIRLGRTGEAEAIPGVDAASAYACAERVAFLRGAYSEAARFGEESLARRASPERAYDVACAYARAGDVRRALLLLERARDLGFSDPEAARTDPDLSGLAGEPRFQAWLDSLGKSARS